MVMAMATAMAMVIIQTMKSRNIIINLLIIACIVALGGLAVYEYNGGFTHKEDKSYYLNGEGLDEKPSYNIYCFGDDATIGVDTDSNYPYLLGKTLYSEAYITGAKGYSTRDLAFYTGAAQFYVRNVTIPKAGTCGIKLYTKYGEEVSITANAISIKIGQIKGVMYQDHNGNTLFTRSGSGEVVTITERTPVEVKIKLPSVKKDAIGILMTGNYDEREGLRPVDTITYQKAILERFGFKKYIIVSATSKRLNENIDTLNDALKKEYGGHYYDFRSFVLKKGLKQANLVITEEDLANTAKGYLPDKLIVEESQAAGSVYYNQLLTQQLIKKLKNVKYIS